jgi:hypothetical protein
MESKKDFEKKERAAQNYSCIDYCAMENCGGK